MKSARFHPATLIATLSAVIAVFALSSAFQTANVLKLTLSGPIQVEGVPTADRMVRIHEGTSYTVPTSRFFVITGTAFSTGQFGPTDVNAFFDGIAVLSVDGNTGSPTGGASEIPPGYAAEAGVVVTVGSAGTGVLLGYLADA